MTRPATSTPSAPSRPAPPRQRKKKPRTPRVRLMHLEVRRGDALCLRIAVADDSLVDVASELGALIKKIAPSALPSAPAPAAPIEETQSIVVSQEHEENDAVYHANLRVQLTELIGSLCDTSLDDAFEVVRAERSRRLESTN